MPQTSASISQRFTALIALAFCALFSIAAFAESPVASDRPATPRVFYADPAALIAAKARFAAKDADLQPVFKKLLADADKVLNAKIPSVMEKKKTPASGDKHDYLTQAPYFWADTNSPDGKYLRRDGERNPESEADSDANRLSRVCSASHALALAYYFTGDEKYAAKAANFIRVFFLNTDTRMNPNLNYGQGVPCESEGRPAGLISARCLVDLVDAIGLIAGSKSWTAADQTGITDWASQYYHWLTTSKIGTGEGAAKNNHGSFYDTQAVSFALFLGKTDDARKIVQEARTKRIARQIEPDGRQPLELARTLSFGYSAFNLKALMDLACLGRSVNEDLWHYETPDGRSIHKALAFMAPYADPKNKWPFPQIHKASLPSLGELLYRAAGEYSDSTLNDALKKFSADEFSSNPSRLYQLNTLTSK